MNPRFCISLLLLFLLSFSGAFATKRALIVAIGNYEKTHTGWPTISCLNDIPLIDSILNQNGFTDKTILKDEQATKEGILNALKKVAMNTRPGDVVLVHFSTHGQLIEDVNGGSPEEAIVAWGAPSKGGVGYKGEKHLLYADIRAIRDTLRSHAGPSGDIILFFDACHSGGLTRGISKIRGGAAPIKIAGWKSTGYAATRGMGDGYLPSDNDDNKGLAPYVAISACKSDELNSEYSAGSCGSLSYALSKAFNKITSRDETYTQLFASLLNDMYDINPGQHPVISGSINRGLFGGQVVPIESHFIISDQDDNGNYILNGGIANGLTKGSVLEACPAGIKSKKDGPALFTLRVVAEPNMLTCEVRVDTSIPNLKYTAYWFYIKQIAFNGEVIRLSMDSLYEFPNMQKSVAEFFKGDTEIVVSAKSPLLTLGYNKQLNAFQVYNSLTGSLLHSLQADNKALKTYLTSYAQCIALKKIAMSNDAYSFSLTLKNADGSDIPAKEGGMLAIKDGDKVKISLSSKHEKPLYINIFDFRPDGTFELIKSDWKLTSTLTQIADAGKPYGADMLLAIASPDPLYLNSLQASSPTRGIATRGSLNSLQKIFGEPATRGLLTTADGEGFTANLIFDIEPK